LSAERRSSYARRADPDCFILSVLQPWIEAALRHALVGMPGAIQRVLDVGCGNQPFRSAIESLRGKYHSMDVVQNACGTVDHIGPLDAAVLPKTLLGRSFDVILCTEVLEHVYDWRSAFDNLSRLTSPGGVVILTCPFFWPLHEQPHDYWRPTPFAVRRAAEQAGFEVAEERLGGGLWDVVGTALGHARFSFPLFGVLGSPFAIGAVIIQKLVMAVLRRRWVQRFVRMECTHSQFYLSNLFLLRRLS
jgi:SAM-dependent methyltransferase